MNCTKEYNATDSSSSSSSDSSSSDSDSSSSDSSSESDSDYASDGDIDEELDDLENLLADRADELSIARSLGATYRVLEVVAETKFHGGKKMDVVVNRISKKINLHAVRRKAAQVRKFVRRLLSQGASESGGGTSTRLTGTNGAEYSVTTDSQGRRQISRVESLERELADLKAMMASLQAGGIRIAPTPASPST